MLCTRARIASTGASAPPTISQVASPSASTTSGTAVCKLRLAVNTRQKDPQGNWGDKPNYFDVTVWGNQGESCAQYLSKGRPVGVDGRLDWREWDAQDGTKRQAVEIIADALCRWVHPDDIRWCHLDDGGTGGYTVVGRAIRSVSVGEGCSLKDEEDFED